MRRLSLIGCLFAVLAAVAYGATTTTTNYSFSKPGDGDSNYGELIRDNWDSVDTELDNVSDSVNDHLADAVDAHDATAISATSGTISCTSETTVQDYLDCLDGVLDPDVSGFVLLTGAQTISGVKTFSTTPIFSSTTDGILSADGSGAITTDNFTTLAPVTTKGDILGFGSTTAARVPVGADGQILEADSSDTEGLSWVNKNPRWRKFTYSYTDFSAASNSKGVTITSLAAEEGIDAVIIKHTTAFSGGSISDYTVEVGQSGNTDEYAPTYDVDQSVGNTVSQNASFLDVPNFGATTDVVVTAKSTNDTLDSATAGSVDIYIRTFVLP